ncbi:MAG: lysophospholipid acyltransferase family protein [Micropepsaceae bacterium]
MTNIRLIVFQVFFWGWSILINLIWLPALLLPRTAVVRGMEIWASVSFWGLKHIVGLDFEVRGQENIPKGAALYAVKHMSMWETIAQHILLRDPAIIMKRELLRVPVYGWYAQKCEMIVIDRGGHAASLRNMIRTAQACLSAGRPVVIFPEGTRKLPGERPDYKPGIAALYTALNVPCVPIALNSGLFWARKGTNPRKGRIVVEILPAIAPGLNRRDFMAQLQSQIETASARLLAEGGNQPSVVPA